MPLKIKQLPESERPYEKLQIYGEKKLSNAELLAIIIRAGTKEETSIDLANRILLLVDNLEDLQNISIQELKQIKGIGNVKAIQIKAIAELASRINTPIAKVNKKINCSTDVVRLVENELRNLRREIIKIIILDEKNRIKKIVDIKSGSINEINITPSQILHEVVKEQMHKFILVHNHPSGDSTPSKADIEFTKRIMVCSKLLGTVLVDHIIIGNENYKSIFSRNKSLYNKKVL